jgi:hypothetical protein
MVCPDSTHTICSVPLAPMRAHIVPMGAHWYSVPHAHAPMGPSYRAPMLQGPAPGAPRGIRRGPRPPAGSRGPTLQGPLGARSRGIHSRGPLQGPAPGARGPRYVLESRYGAPLPWSPAGASRPRHPGPDPLIRARYPPPSAQRRRSAVRPPIAPRYRADIPPPVPLAPPSVPLAMSSIAGPHGPMPLHSGPLERT